MGYQTVAGTSGGDAGSLSPLVPQSIEGTLASATYSMDEIVLWKNIAKTSASNTVHEFVRIEEHGMDLDPFIGESAAGTTNAAEYVRDFCRIKYLGERRELSDVSSLVGIVSANASAVAEETERGTLRLLQKLERSLFHADESVDDRHFSGIITQIRSGAPTNHTDMRGDSLDPTKLQEVLSELYAAPRYGKVDCIYVTPRVHGSLISQTVNFGRHDQLAASAASSLTFGIANLTIMAPYGPVPGKAAPFLHNAWDAPSAGSGTTTGDGVAAPAAPTQAAASDPDTGGNQAGWVNVAGAGDSQWAAADAGDYIWKIVAVGEGGFSAPLVSSSTAVSAGDEMQVIINTPSNARHFRVYRSTKGGDASTCKFISEVKATAGTTTVRDLNANIPGTSKVVLVGHSQANMSYVRLLDLLRRPLAETKTTKPFLLLMFGSPLVRQPTKNWIMSNVGI